MIKEIKCMEGCGVTLGTLELPARATESDWKRALNGYLCEQCAPKYAQRRVEAPPKPTPGNPAPSFRMPGRRG